jgi:hypothetical protein
MKRRREDGAALMMTMDDAHHRIGKRCITKQALYLAASRGDFPTVRVGRRILVLRRAFEAWLTGDADREPAA